MFGIGFSELLLIAVVALIFVGPKKLPDFMRQAGRFFVQMRRTANEVRSTFDQVIQDAENEIRREESEAMRALLETKKELQHIAAEARTLETEAGKVAHKAEEVAAASENADLPVSTPSDNLDSHINDASHPAESESYRPVKTQVKGRYEVVLPVEADESDKTDK